ncbi:MAG: RNHCP domain-containing protein [Chitinophagaceae bacterium]|nr:RNHCP domain-containing protein [Oligoflexus sp.]
MSDQGRFQKINDAFVCEHCARDVPISQRTCRNHCPFCLHSKHVDVFPGDRANPCKGLLVPIGYETHSKKGLMIRFRCITCQAITRNIALLDDCHQPDDYDQILKLTLKS